MCLADARAKFGIVEEKIGEFGALLDEIEFGHAFGFAFEFGGGDSDDFAEDVTRVVERESLVEIADE